MPAVYFNCPSCSQRLSAEPEALRSEIGCPRCGRQFLPVNVIAPQRTLPAIAAPRIVTGPQPARPPDQAGVAMPQSPHAAKTGPLSAQVKTIVMANPAG